MICFDIWKGQFCESASHRTVTVTDGPGIITTQSNGYRLWLRLTRKTKSLVQRCSTRVKMKKLKSSQSGWWPNLRRLFVTQLVLPNQLFLFWQKGLYLPSSRPLAIINRAEGCRRGREAQYGDRSMGCISRVPPWSEQIQRRIRKKK